MGTDVSSVDMTDVQIMDKINLILNNNNKDKEYYNNWGSYATVALTAFQNGRSGISSLLLRLEHSIIHKCNVLIYMGLYTDAASVASMVKDIDLLFLCIIEYEKSLLLSYSSSNTPTTTTTNQNSIITTQ